MIELDVINYLNSDDTLDALLTATGANSKIYPVQSPFGVTFPHVVYNILNDGTRLEQIMESSLSFDCVDSTFSTSKLIRDRIVYLLDREDKIRYCISSASYRFFWCKWVGGESFKETDVDVYHRIALFDFKYQELAQRGNIDMLNKIMPLHFDGIMIDEKIVLDGIYFINPITITKLQLSCADGSEPIGSALTVDLLKDGVEQSRVATLAAGSKYQTTDIADISYSSTERLGIKIKSVGSTFESEDITLLVHYQ